MKTRNFFRGWLGLLAGLMAFRVLMVPLAAQAQRQLSYRFDNGAGDGTLLFDDAKVTGGVMELTPQANSKRGTFIIDALPKDRRITRLQADFLVQIDKGSSSQAADGFSFNFGPELLSSSVGEWGVDEGLAITFDTYDNGADDSAPAIEVKWNGRIVDGATLNGRTRTAFWPAKNQQLENGPTWTPVSITLDEQAGVTVVWNGQAVLSGVPVPYEADPAWRLAFGARTESLSSRHAIDNLEITLQETAAVTVNSLYGGSRVSPPPGTTFYPADKVLALQVPSFIYLDRYGKELDPTQQNIDRYAVSRVRLSAATVNGVRQTLGDGGLDNTFAVNQDTVIDLTWSQEFLGGVYTGTESVEGLTERDVTDDEFVDTLGTHFYGPGADAGEDFQSAVKATIGEGNSLLPVRFASKGMVIENDPNSTDHFVEFSRGPDRLWSAGEDILGDGPITVEFWARRNPTASGDQARQVVLALGSGSFGTDDPPANDPFAAGQQVRVGFDPAGGLFFEDSGEPAAESALPAVDLKNWHYWAVVSDPDAGEIQYYRDGDPVLSQPGSIRFSGDSVVSVAAGIRGNQPGDFYGGALNNLRVWNTTRTREQIKQSMLMASYANALERPALELTMDQLAGAGGRGLKAEIRRPVADLYTGSGTAPADTDGDTFSDAVEIDAGSDPNDPDSKPGLGRFVGVSVGRYWGGDPGEGLDLEGVFPYAINLGPDVVGRIHDAAFRSVGYDGVQRFLDTIPGEFPVSMGGTDPSPADQAISTISKTLYYDGKTGPAISLPNLENDALYKLQLLFHDNWYRTFDVSINGTKVWKHFQPYIEQGGTNVTDAGSVMTCVFVQQGTNLVISLDSVAQSPYSLSRSLSALTLERIPDTTQDRWAFSQPIAEETVPSVKIPDSWQDAGQDIFSVSINGEFLVREGEAGDYTFYLESDDGSRLLLDGQVVVDNEGLHASQTQAGSVWLGVGLHPIQVDFFDNVADESLSLQYEAPDLGIERQVVPSDRLLLAGEDFFVKGDLRFPALWGSTSSTSRVDFIPLGLDGLFAEGLSPKAMLSGVSPTFVYLDTADSGQNLISTPSYKLVDKWSRVLWNWEKQFRLSVSVMMEDGSTGEALSAVSQLPFLGGHVDVDAPNVSDPDPSAGGAEPALVVWVKEGVDLTVGTQFLSADRRYSLKSVLGALNAFADIRMETLLDGIRHGRSTREYHFPALMAPGNMTLVYAPTKFQAIVPIGVGLNGSSIQALNAQVTPDLPDDVEGMRVDLAGPFAQIHVDEGASLNDIDLGVSGGDGGNPWEWDLVNGIWHPLKPDLFNLEWKDSKGEKFNIVVIADFPTEQIIAENIFDRTREDGSREGQAPDYETEIDFEGVDAAFPGAPDRHYNYLVSPNPAAPLRADLDRSDEDRWAFRRLAYSEYDTVAVNRDDQTFTESTPDKRSVLVFSYRVNPASVASANLDRAREGLVVRIVRSYNEDPSTSNGTVAHQIVSDKDEAGFGTGYIIWPVSNYNPFVYQRDAAEVGAWGPIFPVNHSQLFTGENVLQVAYYQNPHLQAPQGLLHPDAAWPYTSIEYNDVQFVNDHGEIYIASRVGSEGLNADNSPKAPLYTDADGRSYNVFDPAIFSELAVYNQPDKKAAGYNPNEEHALVAPSIQYLLTANDSVNLGQSAAFALQNTLNQTEPTDYTSEPYVLVHYFNKVSEEWGMRAYKVEQTKDGEELFPRVDSETHQPRTAEGTRVPQPTNPIYAFDYRTFAGDPLIPPYPLNLVVGNVTPRDNSGGNIHRSIPGPTGLLLMAGGGGGGAADYDGQAGQITSNASTNYSNSGINGGGARVADDSPYGGAGGAGYYGDGGSHFEGGNAEKDDLLSWGGQAYASGNHGGLAPNLDGYGMGGGGGWGGGGQGGPARSSFLNNHDGGGGGGGGYSGGAGGPKERNGGGGGGSYHQTDVTVTSSSEGSREGDGEVVITDPFGSSITYGFRGDFETYTVRSTGEHRLVVRGAQGGAASNGSNQGGKGATMEGSVYLEAGTILQIAVGGKGEAGTGIDNNISGGGGGGASSVVRLSDTSRRALWLDKASNARVVAGDGRFFYRNYYPLPTDFWFFDDESRVDVAWVPEGAQNNGNKNDYLKVNGANPQAVRYSTYWREDYPVLKRGETLTYQGGENLIDHPTAKGLPAVVSMASAQVVYDSGLADMILTTNQTSLEQYLDSYSAQVTEPVRTLEAEVNVGDMPVNLRPGSSEVLVDGPYWFFKKLSANLQKRFRYNSLTARLELTGLLQDRQLGDPQLSLKPNGPYLLQANVISEEDKAHLLDLDTTSNTHWEHAVEELFEMSRDPQALAHDISGWSIEEEPLLGVEKLHDDAVEQLDFYTDTNGELEEFSSGTGDLQPLQSLGSGAALVPNPKLLEEEDEEPRYLTLVENNHPEVDGAVALHIIQIGEARFRGAIQVLEPVDVFDEKISLHHTADFGGQTEDIYYEWWVRDVAPLDGLPTPDMPEGRPSGGWQLLKQGTGLDAITFAGRPDITLADKLFYVRYGQLEEFRHRRRDGSAEGPESESDWRGVPLTAEEPDWTPGGPDHAIPYQWAGAANSPQLQADGSRRYLPQLLMGWVKRILDRVNPYEARFSQNFDGDAPATYTSMLQEAGRPYAGPVALSATKENLEAVGLIELYETVLQRAKELTEEAGAATDGTNMALLLAATRLAELYNLLGMEAFRDAQLSVVSMDASLEASSTKWVATSSRLFAFMNEVPSLLDEELALLRGTDFLKAYPVHNRLIWNYFKGEGEAAYNVNYSIFDVTRDGIINEDDAAALYPQGHGDAWGHLLQAGRMHYNLLRRPGFNWQARAELYYLLGNVVPTDFLDEASFARLAVNRLNVGAQILNSTFREKWVADPGGQWQGYTDTIEPARAWGVSEWGGRVGLSAYFDWVMGNAILPDEALDTEGNPAEGLDRIDREANLLDLQALTAGLTEVQNDLDRINRGANPLGMNPNALTFGINPSLVKTTSGLGKSHFEQVYDLAILAGNNAQNAMDSLFSGEQQLRRISQQTRQQAIAALQQDIDFRNQLIEIYGMPYEGTIGAGKMYPEGYDGPDTITYMYIDATTVDDLTPKAAFSSDDEIWRNWPVKYQDAAQYYQDLVIKYDTEFGVAGLNVDDSGGDEYEEYYLTLSSNQLPSVKLGDTAGTNTLAASVPVKRTARFALQAPGEWGERRAEGQIQKALNELLLAELELTGEVNAYNAFLRELHHAFHATEDKLYRINVIYGIKASVKGIDATFDALKIARKSTTYGVSKIVGVVKTVGETMQYVTGEGSVITALPQGATDVAGKSIEAAAVTAGTTWVQATDVTQDLIAYGVSLLKSALELSSAAASDQKELIGMLESLGKLVSSEPNKRVGLGKKLQELQLAAAEFEALKHKGERLVAERRALNKVLAAAAQQGRYYDMSTRLARNEHAQKYEASLDAALRYGWLAARAFDYETSLSPGHPGSVQPVLEKLIRTRQLGSWANGQPLYGNGGLADILAGLKLNHEVLKRQLGINNPQAESTAMSLRSGYFRIRNDGSSTAQDRWQEALAAARVPDLNAVSAFRTYCRPFATQAAGPQPGLVLHFNTTIEPGQNTFGQPLADGEPYWSSARYATKILSHAVSFTGYDAAGDGRSTLTSTPRAYLIPVGTDRLHFADSSEPMVRDWQVVNERIPVPYTTTASEFSALNYVPSPHAVDTSWVERVRYADFLVHPDYLGQAPVTLDDTYYSTQLIGRSVWNTRWLLIIPGADLGADPQASLDRFIHTVKDIRLVFNTYSHSGM